MYFVRITKNVSQKIVIDKWQRKYKFEPNYKIYVSVYFDDNIACAERRAS